MPQQCTKSGRDTLELITFELTDHNPAPVFPEWTLHSLISSLRGAAELQHRKGLSLWRRREFHFKADPLSKRRIFLNTCFTFAKFFSQWGQDLEGLDHLRLLLYTSAAAQNIPTSFTYDRSQSCFFFSLCANNPIPQTFAPCRLKRTWRADVLSEMCALLPKARNQQWECSTGCLWLPLGTNWIEILQLCCLTTKSLDPELPTPNLLTPLHKKRKKEKKKSRHIKNSQIHNDPPTVLVELSHNVVLFLLCRVSSEHFPTGRFHVVSKRHSCLSDFVQEQLQWLERFASLIHACLTDCTPCVQTSDVSLLESLKSLIMCMKGEIGFEISSKSSFGQNDTKCRT